jgi:hypothetical protein
VKKRQKRRQVQALRDASYTLTEVNGLVAAIPKGKTMEERRKNRAQALRNLKVQIVGFKGNEFQWGNLMTTAWGTYSAMAPAKPPPAQPDTLNFPPK